MRLFLFPESGINKVISLKAVAQLITDAKRCIDKELFYNFHFTLLSDFLMNELVSPNVQRISAVTKISLCGIFIR